MAAYSAAWAVIGSRWSGSSGVCSKVNASWAATTWSGVASGCSRARTSIAAQLAGPSWDVGCGLRPAVIAAASSSRKVCAAGVTDSAGMARLYGPAVTYTQRECAGYGSGVSHVARNLLGGNGLNRDDGMSVPLPGQLLGAWAKPGSPCSSTVTSLGPDAGYSPGGLSKRMVSTSGST